MLLSISIDLFWKRSRLRNVRVLYAAVNFGPYICYVIQVIALCEQIASLAAR